MGRLAKENWRGDANVLEFLVSCGARINGHQEERPLVCAAQSGNIPMLRGLLDAWTSIGVKIQNTRDGYCSICIAYIGTIETYPFPFSLACWDVSPDSLRKPKQMP